MNPGHPINHDCIWHELINERQGKGAGRSENGEPINSLSKYDKYISEMNLIKAQSFFRDGKTTEPKLRNVGGLLNPRWRSHLYLGGRGRV